MNQPIDTPQEKQEPIEAYASRVNSNSSVQSSAESKSKRSSIQIKASKKKKDTVTASEMVTSVEELDKNIGIDLQENVRNYVKVDDEIRKLKNRMEELKKEKRQYDERILAIMTKIDQPAVAISDGKLIVNKYKAKEPFKKDTIKQQILEEFKDAKKAAILAEKIMAERPMRERINLKRTHKKM